MKLLFGALIATLSGVSFGQAPVATMTMLPPSIAEALRGFCAPCSFADAGSSWQATDAIVRNLTDDKRGDLQFRRLIGIKQVGNEWIIWYEHGGIGKHNHTVTFFEAEPAQLVHESCRTKIRGKCER